MFYREADYKMDLYARSEMAQLKGENTFIKNNV